MNGITDVQDHDDDGFNSYLQLYNSTYYQVGNTVLFKNEKEYKDIVFKDFEI